MMVLSAQPIGAVDVAARLAPEGGDQASPRALASGLLFFYLSNRG